MRFINSVFAISTNDLVKYVTAEQQIISLRNGTLQIHCLEKFRITDVLQFLYVHGMSILI